MASINLRQDDQDGKNRAEYSATAAYMFMDDAVNVSSKIPENMTASEAAHDYAFYMIENLREADAACPAWFARS